MSNNIVRIITKGNMTEVSLLLDGTYGVGMNITEEYIIGIDLAKPNTKDYSVVSIVKMVDGKAKLVDEKKLRGYTEPELKAEVEKIISFYKTLPSDIS